MYWYLGVHVHAVLCVSVCAPVCLCDVPLQYIAAECTQVCVLFQWTSMIANLCFNALMHVSVHMVVVCAFPRMS